MSHKAGNYYYYTHPGISKDSLCMADTIYLLATVDYNTVALVNICNGNRFHKPVYVNRTWEISDLEWEMLTDGNMAYFEEIKISDVLNPELL